jgi:hypothetical protein
MTKRRKFLLGMGSLAAGGAAALGTGAFSSVEADRTLTAETAPDADAYLGMAAPGELENDEFATVEGYPEGELELRFDGSGGTEGSGLNTDAVSQFDEVFRITNQGTQPVDVWVDDSGMTFDGRVTFYADEDPAASIEGSENGVRLGVGSSLDVGLEFDTTRSDDDDSVINSPGELIADEDSVTIHADETTEPIEEPS